MSQHIKQISNGEVYTYLVDEQGNQLSSNLKKHPAILNEPDKFIIIKGNPPKKAQKLNYKPLEESTEEL